MPRSKNVENEPQTSSAPWLTTNKQYNEVAPKSPESPWSNYIRKEISRKFQDAAKGKTDRQDRYSRSNAMDAMQKHIRKKVN